MRLRRGAAAAIAAALLLGTPSAAASPAGAAQVNPWAAGERAALTASAVRWMAAVERARHEAAVAQAKAEAARKAAAKAAPALHTSIDWDAIAQCESGGDWSAVSATGKYRGGLQMDMAFWVTYGGLQYAARPELATREQQIAVAERAVPSRGLHPWPVCGSRG